MKAALSLWWRLRAADVREDRRPGLLAVLAFTVATGALLVTLGGLHAFEERTVTHPGPMLGPDLSTADNYVTLAWIAVTCLVIPILTLGGVAARLAIARRDQRLAAMRLAGATSAQVTVMTLAEAATQALLGALGGVVVYGAALPLVSRLSFMGLPLRIPELLLPWWQVLATVGGIVVMAIVSGLSSLAKVAISPLGVATRTSPKRLSLLRLLVAVAAGAAWVLVIGPMKQPERFAIVLVLGFIILAMNVVGPLVIMVAGRIGARIARTPATLLAARRIADDPRSTWRAVGALGLGIMVAGFTLLATSESVTGGAPDQLTQDLATGALVTLVIITVIAATSTGVVQAARVFDQRPQYRALSLAGTPLSTLHRARRYEVAIPLAFTVIVSAGFVLVLFVPFLAGVGAVPLLARFGTSVLACSAVMLLSVTASRSLVADAAQAA